MQFFTTIALLAGAAVTMAAPTTTTRQVTLCSGTEGTAQCCAVDVLGVADLQCSTPPSTPTSIADFTAICAAEGQEARCCALTILGQALLCTAPV